QTVDYKVIIEVGVSQAYDSLLDKARKWIIDNTCHLVILLAFNEKHRILLSPHDRKAQIVQMRRHLRSPSYPKFWELEFLGHIPFHELSDTFIEVVRKAPSSDGRDDLMRRNTYANIHKPKGLSRERINKSSTGNVRLAELIPAVSHNNEETGNIIIDFFDSVTFCRFIKL
ncbi:hypothetical protein V1517DRAFT_357778, partial [Lipomyces orientalis]